MRRESNRQELASSGSNLRSPARIKIEKPFRYYGCSQEQGAQQERGAQVYILSADSSRNRPHKKTRANYKLVYARPAPFISAAAQTVKDAGVVREPQS